MPLVFGTFGDPCFEKILLALGERLVRGRRRHDLVFIGAQDAFDDRALVWLTWHNRLFVECSFADVQTKLCGPFLLVWTVAGKAVVVEDRTDVAVVLNHAASAKRTVDEVRASKCQTD